MKYILLKAKGEIINLPFYDNETNESINEKLIIEYGIENVNYFIIEEKTIFDDVMTNLEITQIVKGVEKYCIESDSSLLYMKLKYPDFYDVIINTNDFNTIKYNVIYLEKLLDMNPKSIDLLYYSKYFPLETLNLFTANDPTKTKKYFKWLCKIHLNKGHIEPFEVSEDIDKIGTLLKDFDNINVKNQMKKMGYSIDLNDYDSENDLFDVVNLMLQSDINVSKSESYAKCLILETGEFSIYEIYEYKDSVTIGRGTFWCTAADSEEGKSNFNTYTKKGTIPLYIIIDGLNKKKYQASIYNEALLDSSDSAFNWHKFPEEVMKFLYDKVMLYAVGVDSGIREFYEDYWLNKPEYLDILPNNIEDPFSEIRIVANRYLPWCDVEEGTIGAKIDNPKRIRGTVWLDKDSELWSINNSSKSIISGENITIKNTMFIGSYQITKVKNIQINDCNLFTVEDFGIRNSSNILLQNLKFARHDQSVTKKLIIDDSKNIYFNSVYSDNKFINMKNMENVCIISSGIKEQYGLKNYLQMEDREFSYSKEKFNKYSKGLKSI